MSTYEEITAIMHKYKKSTQGCNNVSFIESVDKNKTRVIVLFSFFEILMGGNILTIHCTNTGHTETHDMLNCD